MHGRSLAPLLALLALVTGGCTKESTTPTPEGPTPAAGTAAAEGAEPAAASAEDPRAEAELREQDDEAFEALDDMISGARGRATADAAEPPEEPESGPFDRVQFEVDVTAVRASPVGMLIDAALGEDLAACALDLVHRVQSVSGDLALDEDGDARTGVVSVRLAATGDEVAACLRELRGGRQEWVETDVGGRTGYAPGQGDAERYVLVEAEAGWWLLGNRERVEAALAAGTDPAEDPWFAGAVAPLGPLAARAALHPTAGFTIDDEVVSGAPPPLRCLGALWPQVTALAAGANPDEASLRVAIGADVGSAEQALDGQQCLEGAWALLKPALGRRMAMGRRGAPSPPLREMMGSVAFNTAGAFVRVSASVPWALIGQLVFR
jgi:hypothetical protein